MVLARIGGILARGFRSIREKKMKTKTKVKAGGAWVSGPKDLAPPEYFWGYNNN